MPGKVYKWAKVWGIVCDSGELSPGDAVVMENNRSERQAANVTAVVPYTTRAGRLKTFAHVATDDTRDGHSTHHHGLQD